MYLNLIIVLIASFDKCGTTRNRYPDCYCYSSKLDSNSSGNEIMNSFLELFAVRVQHEQDILNLFALVYNGSVFL